MSSAAEVPEEKKSSSRRRPFGNRKKRGPRKPKSENENNDSNKTEKRDKEPIVRPPPIPVPPELINKKAVGTVVAVVRKGKGKFGFLNINDGSKRNDEVPRIYFNFSEIVDKSLFVRRDYIFEFTCKVDESGRSFASELSLTQEGKKLAAEKDEVIAKKKAERAENPETANRPVREKREKKAYEPKLVTLLVSVEGKTGEKSIEVDMNDSIGRLKAKAVAALEVTALYNVFYGEEFLTKAIYKKFTNNDKIRLVEAKPSEK